MNYKRILKKGSSGADVRFIKGILISFGYYDSKIKFIKNNIFGNDTMAAVKKFQLEQGLNVDGIVGELTWNALINIQNKEAEVHNSSVSLSSYTHISADKRKKIEKDLSGVSKLRQQICLEILNYAYDYAVPGNVRALYIFGANLYDPKLNINYADEAEIIKQSKKHPKYFDGGRKEWMIEQAHRNPKLPASDCSGMETGYLRKHKLVKNNFDATANELTTSPKYSMPIEKKDLRPGDWVGKNGHIGTYVGGRYVVEFYGGAYGCQLTDLNERAGWNFIDEKLYKGGPWTRYRRPVFY